jgi:hypothetical protein
VERRESANPSLSLPSFPLFEQASKQTRSLRGTERKEKKKKESADSSALFCTEHSWIEEDEEDAAGEDEE